MRQCAIVALLALLLEALPGSPAIACAVSGGLRGSRPGPEGTITIKLLEAPVNRRDDPHAAVFIVDHVNPGTRFSRRFEVISGSPRPQHVDLYASGAGIRNEKFTFAPDRTANELSSWITLDRSDVQLRPYGSATVKATIGVPRWASKGERYAVIWAQVSSPGPGPQGNIALVNRVGIRTYLDVGPGGDPPSDFKVGEIVPQRTDDGQPKVVATVVNTGERALDLDGQLSLFDGPDSLSAGPFQAVRGTTLAPGNRGGITVGRARRAGTADRRRQHNPGRRLRLRHTQCPPAWPIDRTAAYIRVILSLSSNSSAFASGLCRYGG